jgi:hypothetical protein
MNWGMPPQLWADSSWPQRKEDTVSMNLEQSHAVNRLLDQVTEWKRTGLPIGDDLAGALAVLAAGAYKRLTAGWTPDRVMAELGNDTEAQVRS